MQYKLALIGTGKLNKIVAQACLDGFLPDYELIGVLGRDKNKTNEFATKYDCKACFSIEELIKLKPDYISEAASVNAVKDYAATILKAKINFVVLSIGAFANEQFYNQIKSLAQKNDVKVHIASGSVGGFDILRTASLMSPIEVKMQATKSPQVISKTSINQEGILDIEEEITVFNGNSKEAIEALPTHVNVAIATALASAGVKDTDVEIKAKPDFIGDEYRIILKGEEVETDLIIYSKTSKVAAWSVIALLQNIVSPIQF